MRLIDADKIIFAEIDEVGGEYEPYLGCSKSQIDHLPTVKAIPLERVEQIRARIELEKLGYPPSAGYYKAIMKVLEIIDKALKEQNEWGMEHEIINNNTSI